MLFRSLVCTAGLMACVNGQPEATATRAEALTAAAKTYVAELCVRRPGDCLALLIGETADVRSEPAGKRVPVPADSQDRARLAAARR